MEIAMFVARKSELEQLRSFYSENGSAALVYGKRRVGKTSLIRESFSYFDGQVIYFQCSSETYRSNLEDFRQEIESTLGETFLSFSTFNDVFRFLVRQARPVLVIFDEYNYLKESYGRLETDSMMQKIIDSLAGSSVKLVLCGSAITMMKEVLEAGNPLFDRFSLTIELKAFDYLDSSLFYPSLAPRDKVAFYAVFGGSPAVLEHIDVSRSLSRNIIDHVLSPAGSVRGIVERTLLQEYQKLGPVIAVLKEIGNGKRTYSSLRPELDPANTGNLSRLLSKLCANDALRKEFPINHQDEVKRTFYSIEDNLLRFYFTYVYPNRSKIESVGPDNVFHMFVEPSLGTYVSYRFESIAKEYFRLKAFKGELDGIMDIGTYWYDDKATRSNGEFDCVLEFEDGYDVYECKYLKGRMSRSMADEEAGKIRAITAFHPRRIGLVSVEGFDFEGADYDLVDGAMLYGR